MRTNVFILLMVCIAVPAAAEDFHASNYGDGIRAYAEARYDEALTHLYRAFAAKQEPLALKLIIRAHDFQGNCSARQNAGDMLAELFPRVAAPPAQRCAEVASIDLVCDVGEEVRVDRLFSAACGQRLQVPHGERTLEFPGYGVRVLNLRKGSTVSVAFGPPAMHARSTKKFAQVPQRWIQPNLRVDPDMPRTFEWKRPRILNERSD